MDGVVGIAANSIRKRLEGIVRFPPLALSTNYATISPYFTEIVSFIPSSIINESYAQDEFDVVGFFGKVIATLYLLG